MRSKPPVAPDCTCTSIPFIRLALILIVAVGLASTILGYAQSFITVPPRSRISSLTRPHLKIIQEDSHGDLEVESVVALPEREFLVIGTTGDARRSVRAGDNDLRGSCHFKFGHESESNSRLYTARIVNSGSLGDGRRRVIRCRLTPDSQSSGLTELDQSTRVSVRLEGSTTFSENIPLTLWNRFVFDSLVTDRDVVLFTKGILPARKEDQERELLHQIKCVFLDVTNNSTRILAETPVLTLSQELVRCEHPPPELRHSLLGTSLSIITHPGGTPEPSVVFYDVPRITEPGETSEWISQPLASARTADAHKRYLVCACTMIRNGAKFLNEWIQYHSHLGIERFILYDNNSEDGLEGTVQELNSDGSSATVATRAWPWIKTQELGFSHCALTSRSECEWMAFMDVDEFIFPRYWLPRDQEQIPTVGRTILSRVIDDAESRRFPDRNVSVGQVSLRCREFGPSGLTQHPEAGVTQGYTCRRVKEQRHKSLVKLDALDRDLSNVIHHFRLRPGFVSVTVPTGKGVVNHYKYQAWEEFRHKFKRRVSAYVVDWKEGRNINSQDRAPGLGSEAVKPEDWERRFCEVEDTGLKEYVGKLFRPA